MCRSRQPSRGIRRLLRHTRFDWRPARSQGPLLNPSSLECLQHTRRCTHIPDAASPVCMLLLAPCSVHVALLPAPPDCCSSAACPPLPTWPGAALAAGCTPELPDALMAQKAALSAREPPKNTSLPGPSSVSSESARRTLVVVMRVTSVGWLRSRESLMPTKVGSSPLFEPSDGCRLALLE